MRAVSKLLITAALLAAWACLPAAAQDASRMSTGIKLNGNQPIQIESDRLEVQNAEHQARFSGNVTVTQGDTLMKAGSMVVHYAQGAIQPGAKPASGGSGGADGASGIEKIDVSGKVYVKAKDQVATGDQGSFDMASQVMVLSGGEVVLTDGSNVIKGCKLTVQMNTGQAKFDPCGGGRVQMLLKPNSAGSKAGGSGQ